MLMLLMAIAGIAIPSWILPITNTIGSANGFMAMLMVGTMFEFNPDKSLPQGGRDHPLPCAILRRRSFASLFYFVLPFPLEIRQVLAIGRLRRGLRCPPPLPKAQRETRRWPRLWAACRSLISVAVITCLLAAMGLN